MKPGSLTSPMQGSPPSLTRGRLITRLETIEIASSCRPPGCFAVGHARSSTKHATRLSVLTVSQSRWANVRYFACSSQFGRRLRIISVMLWGSLDQGPVNAGCGVWRSSGTVGVDRNRRDAGFWFSPDPSTRPLRKLTARSHLVPEPIVECDALAAVTDIRGMKESQDLRRSSSPIPARLTGDDLKDGPRSARFHNLRSANRPNRALARARTAGCRSPRQARSSEHIEANGVMRRCVLSPPC